MRPEIPGKPVSSAENRYTLSLLSVSTLSLGGAATVCIGNC